MDYSKSLPVIFAAVVCLTAPAQDASAQARGAARSGTPVGRAVPRAGGPGAAAPRVGIGPYGRYGYPYRPGFGFGFGFYGAFGYPFYGYYGYGYPYLYGYPYGYPYYGYGYPLPPPAYGTAGAGYAYGGVRIQDAPRRAQVFADGYYVGIVDDFDGTFQHLNLPAGVHKIEIRPPAGPSTTVDVNVQPGQTVTYHAGTPH
jgi:hypothetical protein